ncbi:MAG: hypothetical protein KF893_04815 [Caldilineaceae bacterium]|nr:hypothetical protein [Caldilineaceae bacterium]
MRKQNRTSSLLLASLFTVLILFLAACVLPPTLPEAAEPDRVLNLETLETETEFGAVQAQRADNSYIGLIEEGRVIGIAFLDEVGADARPDLQDGIVVYLYDRQDLAMMIGEADAQGAAALASTDLSDFDATVKFVMEDDVVTGTVTFPGEQPLSFTAEAATGVGGVYWAHESDEDADIRCDWVVLPDGRQWGCVCVMPPMMPEHPCCQMLLS